MHSDTLISVILHIVQRAHSLHVHVHVCYCIALNSAVLQQHVHVVMYRNDLVV